MRGRVTTTVQSRKRRPCWGIRAATTGRSVCWRGRTVGPAVRTTRARATTSWRGARGTSSCRPAGSRWRPVARISRSRRLAGQSVPWPIAIRCCSGLAGSHSGNTTARVLDSRRSCAGCGNEARSGASLRGSSRRAWRRLRKSIPVDAPRDDNHDRERYEQEKGAKEQGVVLRLENYIEEAVQRPKQPAEDSPPRNAAQNGPYKEGGEPDARAGRDQVGGSERQMLRERDKQQEEQRDRGPAQGILDRMHGHSAQDLEEKERNEGQEDK